jgi:shikimate kinase
VESAAAIALLGLRCSGKTSVGRELAQELRLPLVDLDEALLELSEDRSAAPLRARYASAGELLAAVGEARFRRLEALALARALEGGEAKVLAPGGGVVELEANRALLAERAFCVWLSVDLARLRERLPRDPTPRPPLLGADATSEIEVLLRRREPLYRAVADRVLDCGDDAPAALARRIAGWVRASRASGGT